MWWDHPFSQRNKAIERAVGVGVGGDRKDGGGESGTKSEKGLGVVNIGGSS